MPKPFSSSGPSTSSARARPEAAQHGLPLPTPSAASLRAAALIALIAWAAIIAQTGITLMRFEARGLTVLDALARLSSYLTNLTVFATAICFTCVAWRLSTPFARFFRKPAVVTAIVIYIAFVGISYNLLLRHLWTPTGYRALLNECLHSIVPLLAVLYWLLFVPRFHLTLRKCAYWLIYPLAYLFITFLRGSDTDFYPYPFIDVGELGLMRVSQNAVLLLLGFLVLMAVFIAINHRRR
ncbi:MAG: Pr6Pr family membrane protein [Janthinobacterium lividum]